MDNLLEFLQENIDIEYKVYLGSMDRLMMQRYALTVGDENPLYFDKEYARTHGYKDIIAHPNYVSAVLGWDYGPPEEELRIDGTNKFKTDELIPDGVRLMGGGQHLELLEPVYPNDEINVVVRVKDVYSKQAKSGQLIFFIRESEYRNQEEQPVVVCTDTLIIR